MKTYYYIVFLVFSINIVVTVVVVSSSTNQTLIKSETKKSKYKQSNAHFYYSFNSNDEQLPQQIKKINTKHKSMNNSTRELSKKTSFKNKSSIETNSEKINQNDYNLETIRERLKEKYNNKTKMIIEELEENTWDYMTELIFILALAFLSIPANLFLFIFYKRKEKLYKKSKKMIEDSNCARIENSFNTYIIEICWFDSIIVSYLVINTTFQVLYHFRKVEYESVFDISNFTCKFFIYILRISGAMSNYLVFLLSLNRGFLIYFNKTHKSMRLAESPRICLNTKYLTLFLFCICTIANVFRLELLNLNNDNTATTVHLLSGHPPGLNNMDNNASSFINQKTDSSSPNLQQLLEMIISSTNGSMPKTAECGPNINSIAFSINNESDALFWSIIIYNISFSIAPALGNLLLSIYLIKKRSQLKEKLDFISNLIARSLEESRQANEKIEDESLIEKNNIENHLDFSIKPYINKSIINTNNNCNNNNNESGCSSSYIMNNNYQRYYSADLYLNEFQIEFLKTCTPCIFFSLTHVILFLPYSIFELINQIRPYLSIIQLLQYMTYLRYMFYCCKFYLLYIASYKFRKEFKMLFKNSFLRAK
jgi:hypothetical protein